MAWMPNTSEGLCARGMVSMQVFSGGPLVSEGVWSRRLKSPCLFLYFLHHEVNTFFHPTKNHKNHWYSEWQARLCPICQISFSGPFRQTVHLCIIPEARWM